MGNKQSILQCRLRESLAKRDHAAVKRAILDGADINQTFGTCPIMWYAVKNSSAECVEILLDHGGHVNMLCSKTGASLLHVTTSNATARILLERGADVNRADHAGNTAVHYLLQQNKMSPAVAHRMRLLRQHGADLQLKNRAGHTALDYFLPADDRQFLAEVLRGQNQCVDIL